MGPLARALREDGTIDDGALEDEMERYGRLFVEELSRVLTSPPRSISLTVLCVEDADDTTRLIATARLMSGWDPIDVHNVIYRKVDAGREALRRIYPRDGGFGSVAEGKKEEVIEHIGRFVDMLAAENISVIWMTCGRGLPWLAEDERAGERFGRNVGCRMVG